VEFLEVWNHGFVSKLKNEPFTDDDARAAGTET
jgi:hypothetical protein